jgi:hypothetical protein
MRESLYRRVSKPPLASAADLFLCSPDDRLADTQRISRKEPECRDGHTIMLRLVISGDRSILRRRLVKVLRAGMYDNENAKSVGSKPSQKL